MGQDFWTERGTGKWNSRHPKAVLSAGKRGRLSGLLFTPLWQAIVWTAGLQLSAWLWRVLPLTPWLRGSSISCLTRRMRTLSTRHTCFWVVSVGRRYVSVIGSEKGTKFRGTVGPLRSVHVRIQNAGGWVGWPQAQVKLDSVWWNWGVEVYTGKSDNNQLRERWEK